MHAPRRVKKNPHGENRHQHIAKSALIPLGINSSTERLAPEHEADVSIRIH
jgi:hypothetical protein